MEDLDERDGPAVERRICDRKSLGLKFAMRPSHNPSTKTKTSFITRWLLTRTWCSMLSRNWLNRYHKARSVIMIHQIFSSRGGGLSINFQLGNMEYLGLKNLEDIAAGSVWIVGKNLCYTNGETIATVLTSENQNLWLESGKTETCEGWSSSISRCPIFI